MVSVVLAVCMVFAATAAAAAERIYYYHNDHLGTPQAMSDEAGRKVWQADYEPYGKTSVNPDPDGDGKLVVNNLRFPGQYFDVETGLHYNYHRDYDPGTGRYLQPDPIGLGGGMNLYGYAENNPVLDADPSGLMAIPWPWLIPAGEKALAFLGAVTGLGAAIGIGEALKNDDCDKPCPPCRLVDGTKVLEGQIGYRRDSHPLKSKHGIVGKEHLHVAECQQNKKNCWCFWRWIKINGNYYVQPPPLPGWIEMQNFINPPPG
jgi:RHS repeat-associated protein